MAEIRESTHSRQTTQRTLTYSISWVWCVDSKTVVIIYIMLAGRNTGGHINFIARRAMPPGTYTDSLLHFCFQSPCCNVVPPHRQWLIFSFLPIIAVQLVTSVISFLLIIIKLILAFGLCIGGDRLMWSWSYKGQRRRSIHFEMLVWRRCSYKIYFWKRTSIVTKHFPSALFRGE